MSLISSCSCLCPIHWSPVLNREWRCSWSSADRRCSKYIWVIEQVYCLLVCVLFYMFVGSRGLILNGIWGEGNNNPQVFRVFVINSFTFRYLICHTWGKSVRKWLSITNTYTHFTRSNFLVTINWNRHQERRVYLYFLRRQITRQHIRVTLYSWTLMVLIIACGVKSALRINTHDAENNTERVLKAHI